jgi:SET and MYND domain-containing protein
MRAQLARAPLPCPAEGGADPAYIGIFLLKYVCPRQGCGGTLAPLPGAPDRFECAMCGGQRSEAEFLAELESAE